MSKYVLDASALLALLQQEPGVEVVAAALRESSISTVNWSEVLQKALNQGVDTTNIQVAFEALGVQFVSFSSLHAELAAQLWLRTKPYGLSFGDRACLALAIDLKATALTADRAWSDLQVDATVQVIR